MTSPNTKSWVFPACFLIPILLGGILCLHDGARPACAQSVIVDGSAAEAAEQLSSVAAVFISTDVRRSSDFSHIESVGDAVGQHGRDEDSLVPDDARLRVAFLGNTLIHRATEYGYLETELTRLLPGQDIVFRNLGWPGDTVAGAARVEFGPGEENYRAWQRPDQDAGDYGLRKMLSQLKQASPDVLFIAYGSIVAFQREQGLSRFRAGLERLLDALQPTGVRVVLLAPPPREIRAGVAGNLAEQNRWLEKVARHLERVAAQRKLAFVDLFGSWPAAATEADYTDNGIHLNARGYQWLADIVAHTLLPVAETGWYVRIHADGSILESRGTEAAAIKPTEYGMRWKVTDALLPAAAFREPLQRHARGRQLRIEGLKPGTHSLDIDGRRVARGSAQQWAAGMTIQTGPDFKRIEALRQTILQKNRLYFYGFRPQNKAYIHLFRRHERGHHAAEMERFALLVAEAEKEIARLRVPVTRIYELVREKDYPEHEVPGEATKVNIEDELAAFRIPEGFEISLFASEPMLSKPININWDERGRMWVATSTIYPHLQPGQTPDDRILILEDLDGDGRADKRTVFADGLLVPHSVIPGDGGAYVAQSTDLLFLRDTDGDGQADERRVLLTGFGNADVHHMIHGLRWGPGGDLYFTQSIYINSFVETPWGVRTSSGSCVWRLRPETLRLEKLGQGMVNPWGHAFDPWGQSFATDGAGGGGISYLFPGSAHASYGYAGRELPSLNPGRPKECGLEFLSGRHLPATWQNTFMTNDFRANRVTRYRLTAKGSGYTSQFLGDMITSSQRGFRPVDIKMGPDGAIYIVDWYNVIIDHGEVDFHHPLRDKRHGRIWRLKAKNTSLVTPPRLANATVTELLAALRVPEQWTRDQARRLLRERESEAVMPKLRKWVAEKSLSQHDQLEALWVCQGLRTVEQGLLEKCLRSEDPRVRAAAVRVLSDWHDRVAGALERLEEAIQDPHAQVRLEAVHALRRVGTRGAVELALRALDQPTDVWLEFALFRTVHELRDVWLGEFQAGEKMFQDDARQIAFALSAVGSEISLEPLAKLVRTRRVSNDRLVETLKVLASFGNAKQRALVLDRWREVPIEHVGGVLAALVQSNRDRIPANSSLVHTFFDSPDARVRKLAMELAGRWRLAASLDELRLRAEDPRVSAAERLVAGQAIMAIDPEKGLKMLEEIYRTASAQVRATTVAAWLRGSPAVAAALAVELFASEADTKSVALIAEAFLQQKEGPQYLAAALQGARIPGEVAQVVIDRVRLTGQEMEDLVAALRKAGRLKVLAKLTPEQISRILQEISSKGNARRGESIFLRQRLQCVACHAVKGSGGQIGPDLSSLGGSARIADILQSLLDPSASIKEGYQTAHIVTVDGRIVTGILQRQTVKHATILDGKDQLHTIPIDDIDAIEASKLSLMPNGLIEILSRDELIDLVRYLSSLGREPPELP